MTMKRLTAFVSVIAICITGAALSPAGALALDPILFVHGWSGSASNWNTMIGRFEKDGYPKSYLSAYSSMGSLNTRWYIKFVAGGEANVDDWVSLGGPNHGTETANLCFSTACTEMRIGSTFLKELNAGDETPGAVNYGTWWSPCDEFINPDSSVPLSGATNTETACISHLSLLTDETVYKQVREFIE
jgi:triacylglycerol lipase